MMYQAAVVARCGLICLALSLGGCLAEDGDEVADVCKPLAGIEAIVVVGQGREEFATLAEDETVDLEAGPQGGHHIWIAVQMMGLHQGGSVLSVRGYFPDLDVAVPPFTSGVTFHETERSGCEIHGIRFQVDREMDLEAVLGERLELEVIVEDPSGDIGSATKTVRLADSIHEL
jgi:hypothetical protein